MPGPPVPSVAAPSDAFNVAEHNESCANGGDVDGDGGTSGEGEMSDDCLEPA